MAENRKNLCAMIPVELHERVRAAQEQAGVTLSAYITGCQRRCDFVVFRRTRNVEKWRVSVYSS